MNIGITLKARLRICFNQRTLLSIWKVLITTCEHFSCRKADGRAGTSAVLAIFLNKMLTLTLGMENLPCRGKIWQTEMDGYRFLSSQHLCSQPFFFQSLLLHFNKLLLSKMPPYGLIDMQEGDVLISGMA